MRARKLRIALAMGIFLLVIVAPMFACGASQNAQPPSGKTSAPNNPASGKDGARYTVHTDGDPIATTALVLQENLYGPRANQYDSANPFLTKFINYWKDYCSGTTLCDSGNLQCVSFVVGVFGALGHPLPAALIGDGHQFWDHATNLTDWEKISVPLGPNNKTLDAKHKPQRGDLIGWSGGAEGRGHIAIVVDLQEPTQDADGWITIADANFPGDRYSDVAHTGNTSRLTWHYDGRIDNWPNLTIQGFMRQTTMPPMTIPQQFYFNPSLLQGLVNVPDQNKPWETLAVMASAHYQIYPPFFVNQLNAESGMEPYERDGNGNIVKDQNGNPKPKTSPNNAIGIAQFLQSAADEIPRCSVNIDTNNSPDCGSKPGSQPSGKGIDPAKPGDAIPAAAYHMRELNNHYQSYCPNQQKQTCPVDSLTSYTRAVAAYNAGQGRIDNDIQQCDRTWLSCSPSETQNYVIKIVGCPLAEKGGVTCSADQKKQYPGY
jgi:hypothetical protein